MTSSSGGSSTLTSWIGKLLQEVGQNTRHGCPIHSQLHLGQFDLQDLAKSIPVVGDPLDLFLRQQETQHLVATETVNDRRPRNRRNESDPVR